MLIAALQQLLRDALENIPPEDRAAIEDLVNALDQHKEASVSALAKKLTAIKVPVPKPRTPRATRATTTTPRPKPTKAQITEATAEFTKLIREQFYDDNAFRELVSRISKDPRVTKDAAVQLFESFFGQMAFEKKGLKKPFVVKQIQEHRNTQALREGRTGASPP